MASSNDHSPQNSDVEGTNPELSTNLPSEFSASAFQALMIDQLAKIQEQNEGLKTRIVQLEQDQREFYIDTCKKLERGARSADKSAHELNAMKEVFKEIVGVMSGERVRFLDHSGENVTTQEAANISESLLLSSNHESVRRRQEAVMYRDSRALDTLHVLKQEDTDIWSRLNHPDFAAPSAQTESSDYAGDQNENIQDRAANYKMNRLLKTVTDVAREYFEGLQGQPSVMALERRFGPSWRCRPSERSFFAKRMQIINRIVDIKKHPSKYNLPDGITRKKAIRVVENMRLGNNSFHGQATRMTLNQLYIYLAKKMDTPNDYSLQLLEFARPRRDLLLEKRNEDTQSTQPGSSSNDLEEESRANPGPNSEENDSQSPRREALENAVTGLRV
ncbi:LANO_0D07338g1_1 [Lachancea nothofagi CBS 11611]|uniref:LANO_0D07338g1_1 n=1 Tax=Lachancea nothofagi CBS 11611 TaxID=1266666 RepID=A0A1G4JI04_9SACH|nr:LANO_0D07338g1_1 [Lachancea nothofagi CBS 11611]